MKTVNKTFNYPAEGSLQFVNQSRVDIICPIGSEVKNPAPCKVRDINVLPDGRYVLEVEFLRFSMKDKIGRFYYLNELFFDVGQKIKKGSVIGYSGKNGSPKLGFTIDDFNVKQKFRQNGKCI
jgi:hypothetical protein